MAPNIKLDGTSVASMGWLRETIPFPMPQSQFNTIVMPGRNFPVRFTKTLGRMSYQPRSLSLTSSMFGARRRYDQMIAEMTSHYTGQLIKASTSEEPELYAIGTLETSSEHDPLLSKDQPMISCENIDSYHYHNEETVVNLAGPGTLIIENDFMPVAPVITTSAETALSWTIGGDSFRKSLNTGTWTFPELELQAGRNTVTIQGNGATIFRFKEGHL